MSQEDADQARIQEIRQQLLALASELAEIKARHAPPPDEPRRRFTIIKGGLAALGAGALGAARWRPKPRAVAAAGAVTAATMAVVVALASPAHLAIEATAPPVPPGTSAPPPELPHRGRRRAAPTVAPVRRPSPTGAPLLAPADYIAPTPAPAPSLPAPRPAPSRSALPTPIPTAPSAPGPVCLVEIEVPALAEVCLL
jgi:hypothetical protein